MSTPTSSPSGRPSEPSSEQWLLPVNVRQFAAQANEVATMVLNGTLPIETARTYATLARVVAQTITAEVARARFIKSEPELTFERPSGEK